MPFPSLATIAEKLSVEEIEHLLVLKRTDPKLQKLEARRSELYATLADIDRQMAELTGEKTPKAPGKRGRKPGRPAKGTPGRKRGRPAKATAAPTKRGPGRPPKGTPPAAKGARPRGRPTLSGPEAAARREAMLANLTKARAARAVNRTLAETKE